MGSLPTVVAGTQALRCLQRFAPRWSVPPQRQSRDGLSL